VFLGRALQTVTPATNSITAAMVGNDLISGKDALASEPADTDEFLVSDAGTLKRIDYSLIKGGGITEADMYRLTTDTTGGTNADVTSNLERVDDATFSKIGTGMSESSGIFTFPSTGLYQVIANPQFRSNADSNSYIVINVSSNSGSAYDEVGHGNGGNGASSDNTTSVFVSSFVNVTNASNFRVKFTTTSMGSNSFLSGNTNSNYTNFVFIRLGDSQ
jgi:hypothetical protein